MLTKYDKLLLHKYKDYIMTVTVSRNIKYFFILYDTTIV